MICEGGARQGAGRHSETARLKRFFQSEAGATVLWVVSVLVLAAGLAPWLYQAGKSLAMEVETNDLPAILEWLGAACGRADFSRYFGRALVAAAVVLLPFLCHRVRAVRAATGFHPAPGARLSWQSALGQVVTGCVIAAAVLWGLGMLLEALGAFVPKVKTLPPGRLLAKIVIPAVVVSLIEEWLFRGLLLGLWLRFSRPLVACVGTSFFFAFIHFLRLPEGESIANPAALLAGYELLGKILLHFAEPRFFVTDFATLFVIGMILAWARVRTGALWFSIGLHAGWILAFKGFNLLHCPVPGHSLQPWGVGISLRSGLFPMLSLAVTAAVCFFALRVFAARQPISRASP